MRSRIAFKLAAIWLIVAIPLTTVLVLTYRQWYEARVSLIEEQRLGYARLSGTSFSTLVSEIQRTLQISGEDLLTRRASSNAVSAELRRLAGTYPASSAVLLDSQGSVIAASRPALVGLDLSGHVAIRRAMSAPDGRGIEPSTVGEDDVVGFHIAKRIETTSGPTGDVLAVFIDVRRLHDEFPVDAPTGGISVIDSTGQVVFQNESTKFASLRENWGARYPFVRRALQGNAAPTRDFAFPLGGRRIGAFVPIPGLGWAAGSSVDAREALQPFYRGLWFGLPIALALLGIALLLSNGISHRITKSLVTLSAHAERIGNGRLDEPVKLGRTDEIGDVADSLEEARRNLARLMEENEALFQQQRQTAELNGALADIDDTLHSTLQFRDILARVVERAAEVLGCDMAGVNLREDGNWVRIALVGVSEAFLGERMTDEQNSVAALVAQTAEPVIIDDASSDPRINPEFASRYDIKASMVLPLIVREEVVGVVFFNHIASATSFTDQQVRFASQLSYSLSLAYENARLYEAEHGVAEVLQTALLVLPERIEGLAFASAYRSATETARVGGDFYDLFKLDDGRIGLTIGDMSGHGIDAAVLTSRVKNAIRVKAMDAGSVPSDAVATANRILVRDSSPEMFASVFFGILDPREDRITYCGAGHPAPCTIDSDGTMRWLESNSPVIGAFDALDFVDSQSPFAEGGLLLLYTDGLIEARNGGGFFGEERLLDLLREQRSCDPAAVIHRVVDAALAFAGGRLSDDLAVLAACRQR